MEAGEGVGAAAFSGLAALALLVSSSRNRVFKREKCVQHGAGEVGTTPTTTWSTTTTRGGKAEAVDWDDGKLEQPEDCDKSREEPDAEASFDDASFDVGAMEAEAEHRERQLQLLTAANGALRDENASLRASLDSAESAHAELERERALRKRLERDALQSALDSVSCEETALMREDHAAELLEARKESDAERDAAARERASFETLTDQYQDKVDELQAAQARCEELEEESGVLAALHVDLARSQVKAKAASEKSAELERASAALSEARTALVLMTKGRDEAAHDLHKKERERCLLAGEVEDERCARTAAQQRLRSAQDALESLGAAYRRTADASGALASDLSCVQALVDAKRLEEAEAAIASCAGENREVSAQASEGIARVERELSESLANIEVTAIASVCAFILLF